MKRLIPLIFIILLGQHPNLRAQSGTEIISDSLKMIGKYDGDKVILRWYPTTPTGWSLGNNYGYNIERIELSDSVSTSENSVILADSLKPADIVKIGKRFKENQNKYLAIAGELLHGKKDYLRKSDKEANPFAKADAYSNMHNMAMLTAELDAEAGLYIGLRYEDLSIKPNATYAYQLILNNPLKEIKIDTAYIVIRTHTPLAIPTPKIKKVYWGDKQIKISWSRDDHKSAFTAYHIERSADGGKTYDRITKDPYIYSNTIDSKYDYIYYDSIPKNEVTYKYRIIGINSFAEESPPSPSVEIQGKDKIAPSPAFDIKTEYLGDSQLKISWKTNPQDQDIAGYMISKSPYKGRGFENITPQGLSPNENNFIDDQYNRFVNNYYFVGVIDEAGNTSISMPHYAEFIDSIPPAPVTGIMGSIDTNGIVTLKWHKSNAPDVKGYFVHFSNQKDHVFAALNGYALIDTTFTDTINVRDILTEEIFYKVVAVDHNMNYSKYSQMASLKKPDFNPPVAPLFKEYKVHDSYIHIRWVNSSSLDVISHRLERRTPNEEWATVATFKNETLRYSEYKDSTTVPGKAYQYRISALDDDDLHTYSPKVLSITFKGKKILNEPKISALDFDKEKRTLSVSWKTNDNYDLITVYRSKDKGPLRIVDTVLASDRKFYDRQLKRGSTYEYAIKAKNSSTGKMSKIGNREQFSFE